MFAGFILCFSNATSFCIGRFILGLAMGIASVIPPVLLTEISTLNTRATIGNFHQCSITLAQLGLYSAAAGLVYVNSGWRWANGILFIIGGFIAFLAGFLTPESMQYLLKQNQDDLAYQTLAYVRSPTWTPLLVKTWYPLLEATGFGSPDLIVTPQNQQEQQQQTQSITGYAQQHDSEDVTIDYPVASTESPYSVDDDEDNIPYDPVQEELNLMREKLASSCESVSWGELFNRETLRYQLILLIGLHIFQPLSGVNSIGFFATKIFGLCGLNDAQILIGTMMVGLLGFVFSMSSTFMMNWMGRKFTIILGSGLCAGLLALLSIVLLTMDGMGAQGPLALFLSLTYIAGFNLTQGGPIWTVSPELMAPEATSKLSSLYCMINWACNFFVVFLTLPAMTLFGGGEADENLKTGAGYLFLVWVATATLGGIFFYFWLIETQGKSPEQIQTELGNPSFHDKTNNVDMLDINNQQQTQSDYDTRV
eukprot:UN00608